MTILPTYDLLISTVIDASLKHNKPSDDGLFHMIYKPGSFRMDK